MSKGRMEAFSDGVIAILITIMVLNLRAPLTGGVAPDLATLRPVLPDFLCYVLSFLFLGIYWNNHHHLLQATQHVDGRVLWANLHLLFWLSLVPFATAWMGENEFAPWPVALYGVVLLLAAVAYFLLVRALIALHGQESTLAVAMGSDFKGKISMVVYLVAVPLAFVQTWLAFGLYVSMAILWLVPDRRIEKEIGT